MNFLGILKLCMYTFTNYTTNKFIFYFAIRLCTKADFHAKRPSSNRHSVDVESYMDADAAYQTSCLSQYVTLTRRNFLRHKDRYVSGVWLTQTLVTACAVAVVWFQLLRTEETARDRFGLVSALRRPIHRVTMT